MDTLDQMRLAEHMTRMLVAELRAGGCNPLGIAATLCAAAGSLYREQLQAKDVRPVISHMAEGMIKGDSV